MQNSNSINPFDNLYEANVVKEYFGLDAITRERAKLEILYLQKLMNILHSKHHIRFDLSSEQCEFLNLKLNHITYNDLIMRFGATGHEIKALEYYIKSIMELWDIPGRELVHWGITSQDIVDPIYTIAIRNFIQDELSAGLSKVADAVTKMVSIGENCVFPARTHGQLAIPTTMAREFAVYSYRLSRAINNLFESKEQLRVKFGGAIGTLMVHSFTDQSIDWRKLIALMFNEVYHISVHPYTTQVNSNDDKARVFQDLININNILIDMCQNIWMYFSNGYLNISRPAEHVGSSTMAHKNNPIEFENVEGMLQYTNSELHFFADKLTRSRGQRDLSDSVVQRFYGMVFSKMFNAYEKLASVMQQLVVTNVGIPEIMDNYQVYTELLQCYCRLKGLDRFEQIKQYTNSLGGMNQSQFFGMVNDIIPDYCNDFLGKLNGEDINGVPYPAPI